MKKVLVVLSLFFLAAACAKPAPEVLVPPTQTSNEPGNSGSVSSPAEQSYTSAGGVFSVKYGSEFSLQTDYEKVKALGYIPVCSESMEACIFYSGSQYTGTNFEAAGVSINALTTKKTEAQCYNFSESTSETQHVTKNVTIGNLTFRSATGGSAGAGHMTQAQSYRIFLNNNCYEILQTLGNTNIGAYEPGTIKEFNSEEVWSKLQTIVETVIFSEQANASAKVSLTGTVVCLPHKNTKPGQPQTMECAFGLQEQGSGKYYSLKNTPTSMVDMLMTGNEVTVTGTLSDDSKSNYDIAGALTVSSIAKVK